MTELILRVQAAGMDLIGAEAVVEIIVNIGQRQARQKRQAATLIGQAEAETVGGVVQIAGVAARIAVMAKRNKRITQCLTAQIACDGAAKAIGGGFIRRFICNRVAIVNAVL